MYSGEYDTCDVTLSVYPCTPGKLEKYASPRWESNLRPLDIVFVFCVVMSLVVLEIAKRRKSNISEVIQRN